MRFPRYPLALLFSAALVLTGFTAGAPPLTTAPRAGEMPPTDAVLADTVMVFVVWGNSNACGQGTDNEWPHPSPPTPIPGTAYEWYYANDPNFPPVALQDPFPCGTVRGTGCTGQEGDCPGDDRRNRVSAWPQFAYTYHDLTGRFLFMSSGAQGGSNVQWHPDFAGNPTDANLYDRGLGIIEDAMAKAAEVFPPGQGYEIVFGGVLWTLTPALTYGETGDDPWTDYPWAEYRDDLRYLLERFGEDVVASRGGRFYLLNTVIRRQFPYPEDGEVKVKFDFGHDLEADVCGEFAYCSVTQESISIKLAYNACAADPNCDNRMWYVGGGGAHWGYAALNQIGSVTAQAAVAHGLGEPVTWEVGVEVPMPAAWCADPPCAPGSIPAFRLYVYDDAGVRLAGFEGGFPVEPSIASPDWTASFDGAPDADWVAPDWALLNTTFVTLELVREDQPSAPLARYVYVPTAAVYGPTATDFYRPAAATGPAAVRLEVFTDGSVRARDGAWALPGGGAFEDVFAGGYVIPYNHGVYAAGCAVGCPPAPPGYFLAPVPATGPLPTAASQRYVLAEEADVVLPSTWGAGGVLVWDVPGLVLAFPEGRRLLVEGTLVAEGVRLTEAAEDEGWGGVVYLSRVPEAALPASVLRGSVVERVRVPSSGGIAVPYGAVSVHGRDLTVENLSEIRNGGAGVVGLLATGEATGVAVTGLSVISSNGGGGVRATGGARVTVSGASRIEENPGVGVRSDGFGTLITLVGASVLDNGGIGVRALSGGEVRFANTDGDPATHVERNAGGLDAGGGGSVDAGRCGPSETAPCPGRRVHFIVDNDQNGTAFDARALTGSTLYAQGNDWDVTDISQLVLVEDPSSVLVVCPILGGGACGIDHRLGAPAEGAAEGREPEDGEPLRIEDVLALVDEAERARLAGDAEAFDLAASAAVAAIDTSQVEDARRAAFEVTARLFAWAQPPEPLADLVALSVQPGAGRPWALRALGVARAASEDYAAARAVADTLASAYSGGEHAAFGLGLAVRVSVLEHDEAAAVAALVALAAAFPEADELGSLAALVVGAFPGADLSGLRLGALGGGAAAPGASAQASASSAPAALLVVGEARPNPSSGAMAIPFELSAEARVEAVLYDVLGRRLAVLAPQAGPSTSGVYAAGRHVLILEESLARRLPSGTYIVYVTARVGAGAPASAEGPAPPAGLAARGVAVRRLTLTR